MRPDYKHINAIEAVRHSKDISGLTLNEIARKSGIGKASIGRYLQNEDGYCPGLDKLPALIRALGNEEILQWLLVQLDYEPERVEPAKNRAQVLTAGARASASMGEVMRILADSEERGIDPVCAREARSMIWETIAQLRRAYAMLDEQASYRNMTEVAPLASMKEGYRKRGWKEKLMKILRMEKKP